MRGMDHEHVAKRNSKEHMAGIYVRTAPKPAQSMVTNLK